MKKIIHVDMDAFFASIEQRDNPTYRGRPLAVGYSGERGVVSAASYEARRWGVRSAMSSKMAISRCPDLVFVPGRFEVYRSVSRQIMEIFFDYTDLVEPLSLDEAYLDVTENHKAMRSATLIAREIKQRIKDTTGLTASAGVSVNKFLAKVASDYDKPDGLTVITGTEAEDFVATLRIEDFFGVGRVTAEKMHRYGIRTGADLRLFGEENLTKLFGKAGHIYYENAWGRDDREVKPHRIRKSIGAENTFMTDLANIEEIAGQLHDIAERVWRRIADKQFLGRTVTLKVKYGDFEQISRSRTLGAFVDDFNLFWETAHALMLGVDISRKSIRLLGLSISNIDEIEPPSSWQLELDFDDR
jgi:DNA polymerase-4